jgi:hypothetical protein
LAMFYASRSNIKAEVLRTVTPCNVVADVKPLKKSI